MVDSFVTIDDTEIQERLGEFCGDADEAKLVEFLPSFYSPAIVGVTDTKRLVYSANRIHELMTNNGKSVLDAFNDLITLVSSIAADTNEYKPYIVYAIDEYSQDNPENLKGNDFLKSCIQNIFKNVPDILDKIAVFDDYTTAVIGIGDEHIFYDQEAMIQYLIDVEGMSEEDAYDYFSYNTERTLPYMTSQVEKYPIIVYNFIDNY